VKASLTSAEHFPSQQQLTSHAVGVMSHVQNGTTLFTPNSRSESGLTVTGTKGVVAGSVTGTGSVGAVLLLKRY